MDAVARWAGAIWALPRPLLLAFDVDGTLAPIVQQAHRARVPRQVQRALRQLDDQRGVRVALITGRDARQLAGIVPDPLFFRATSHGKSVARPGEAAAVVRLRPAQRDALAAFGRDTAQLAELGADIERKSGAWGVHTRRLAARDPQAARRVQRRARALAKQHGLSFREGRSVVEVEALVGDKGQALARIQRLARARGVFYAGDDVTDLPALRYAIEQKGIGLFVRSAERRRAPNGLSGSLAGPEQVAALVDSLVGQI